MQQAGRMMKRMAMIDITTTGLITVLPIPLVRFPPRIRTVHGIVASPNNLVQPWITQRGEPSSVTSDFILSIAPTVNPMSAATLGGDHSSFSISTNKPFALPK
uniref:Uncharacterized protein n=1 Tax=Arundo donax TaxID=35708 RepID=A0A0A8Y010_ARUDO